MDSQFDDLPKVKEGKFPPWLHRKLPKGGELWATGKVVGEKRLPTVCEEAKCPNQLECWTKKAASFLAMGSHCTRACGFCEIDTSKEPPPLEADEPERVAESVKELGLRHVVITMVARDDLEDGGGDHLGKIVAAVHAHNPGVTVELLTSDLEGNLAAFDRILQEEIAVFNHNIETVERLTPRVRHKATYERSLRVLRHIKEHGGQRFLKSGLMLGLGEEEEEVHQALRDLHAAGVEIVTMGQYLQPSRRKLRVKRFVTPEQFDAFADYGRSIGIPHMYCGPFVRSSYNADLFV
jgi:lipoyl synthase